MVLNLLIYFKKIMIMELIVVGLFVFFGMVMALSGSSKSSTLKGQFKDGLSELTTYAGKAVQGAGESLKASSIESQIKKIDLKAKFTVRYQEYHNVVFMYSEVSKSYYADSEITELIKNKAIKEGEYNDKCLIENIKNSDILFKKLKELNIACLNVSSSEIGYSHSANQKIKKRKVLRYFEVGSYGFIDKSSLINQPEKPKNDDLPA